MFVVNYFRLQLVWHGGLDSPIPTVAGYESHRSLSLRPQDPSKSVRFPVLVAGISAPCV